MCASERHKLAPDICTTVPRTPRSARSSAGSEVHIQASHTLVSEFDNTPIVVDEPRPQAGPSLVCETKSGRDIATYGENQTARQLLQRLRDASTAKPVKEQCQSGSKQPSKAMSRFVAAGRAVAASAAGRARESPAEFFSRIKQCPSGTKTGHAHKQDKLRASTAAGTCSVFDLEVANASRVVVAATVLRCAQHAFIGRTAKSRHIDPDGVGEWAGRCSPVDRVRSAISEQTQPTESDGQHSKQSNAVTLPMTFAVWARAAARVLVNKAVQKALTTEVCDTDSSQSETDSSGDTSSERPLAVRQVPATVTQGFRWARAKNVLDEVRLRKAGQESSVQIQRAAARQEVALKVAQRRTSRVLNHDEILVSMPTRPVAADFLARIQGRRNSRQ